MADATNYIPNDGDVVNVIQDLHGTDAKGNPYTISAPPHWYSGDSVVKIITISKSGISINDGTQASPIQVPYTETAFEAANWVNRTLFKPFAITAQVVDKTLDAAPQVVDAASNVVQGASSAVSFLGKNLKWILIGLVVVAIVVAAVYAKNMIPKLAGK